MGERFTANQVGSLRRYRNIPSFQPSAEPPLGSCLHPQGGANSRMNTSSIHRWWPMASLPANKSPRRSLADSNYRGVARPHRAAGAPEYLPMLETTMKLGVSRQTYCSV